MVSFFIQQQEEIIRNTGSGSISYPGKSAFCANLSVTAWVSYFPGNISLAIYLRARFLSIIYTCWYSINSSFPVLNTAVDMYRYGAWLEVNANAKAEKRRQRSDQANQVGFQDLRTL